MKKYTAVITALIILLSVFSLPSYGEITDRRTPVSGCEAVFIKKFGQGYKDSPMPPVYYENSIYVVSGRTLLKLSAKDGSEEKSVKTGGESLYSVIPPLCTEGKIYIALDGGIIEAYTADTLEFLWQCRSSGRGQAINYITLDNGTLYTAFWRGEEKTSGFVAVDSETGSEKWCYTSKGGFYWNRSLVKGSYVLTGHDNGRDDFISPSSLLAIDKNTGIKAAELPLDGDIRSGITEDENGILYVSSKAGKVYKFSFDESSCSFSLLGVFNAPGLSITSTPVVYKGRMYIGTSNGSGGGKFVVIDTSSMTEIYSAETKGMPQAEMLLSNAYEEKTGKVYIYTTYNNLPGGISVFEDSPGQTEPASSELFLPSGGCVQYCISPITAGKDGTLYYKNDSGCIFAINSPYAGIDISRIIAKVIEMLRIFTELIKTMVRTFN